MLLNPTQQNEVDFQEHGWTRRGVIHQWDTSAEGREKGEVKFDC